MLGKRVCAQVEARGIPVVGFGHSRDIANGTHVVDALAQAQPKDVVINCAGLIPLRGSPAIDEIATNALGPHVIGAVCRAKNLRMVQVSTDCVFNGNKSGVKGRLKTPDAVDLYGRTKAIGEVGDLIIRTSFVGPEHGLWQEVFAATGPLYGYTDWLWSGSTVWDVAASVVDVALSNKRGIVHLATKEPISKFAVVSILNRMADTRPPVKVVSVGGDQTGWNDRSMKPNVVLRPFEEAMLGWYQRDRSDPCWT